MTPSLKLTGTTSTWQRCLHPNGFFKTLHFWGFKRNYFFCSDCGAVMLEKWYRLLVKPKGA